jgi:hypothetical protein
MMLAAAMPEVEFFRNKRRVMLLRRAMDITPRCLRRDRGAHLAVSARPTFRACEQS